MINQEIIEVIHAIRNTSATKGKLEIAKKNIAAVASVFEATYNPYIKYGLSLDTLRALSESDVTAVPYGTLEEMLHDLHSNNINDQLRSRVSATLRIQSDDVKDVLMGILSKDLRLNMGVTQLNKAGLSIPVFDVQLAYPEEKYPLKDGERFVLMKKINGVRAVLIDNVLYTRQGHEYLEGYDAFQHLPLGTPGYVFDGELELRDEIKTGDDNKDFRAAVSAAKKGEWDQLQYVVFDMIEREVFDGQPGTLPAASRIGSLMLAVGKLPESIQQIIKVVPVYYIGDDVGQIQHYMETVVKPNNYEGLMVARADGMYELKRTKNIIKVKEFFTADLAITEFVEGGGRLEGTLGNVVVDFEGNSVGVGSGFNDEMRNEIWENKDKYLGRVIEVRYKEISVDEKTGSRSLQFPTFVRIREEGKEVNVEQ